MLVYCVSLYGVEYTIDDDLLCVLGLEEMSLIQLFVPTEVAHDAVAELGELGNVQFKDVRRLSRVFFFFSVEEFHRVLRQLNPGVNAFQRSFLGEIRRIDEMARRVRFFATQIGKEKSVVPIRALVDSAPLITVGPRAAHTMDELDVALKEHEARLVQMNSSYQTLSERTRELHEARYVLRETAVFFERVSQSLGGGLSRCCVGC